MYNNVRKNINIILTCVFIMNLLFFLPITAKSESSASSLNEPTVFNAYYIINPQQVFLAWEGNWSETVLIDIERKSEDGNFTLVYTVINQNQKTWIDFNVFAKSTYTYRLKVRKPDGLATPVYSKEVVINSIALNTSGSLYACAISPTEINLTWSDVTYSDLGYELWRKSGESGSWEKYAKLPSGVLSFTDRGVSTNTVYYYKIMSFKFYNNYIYSSYSNDTLVKTSLPDIGITLDYSMTSGNYVKLEWSLDYSKQDLFSLSVERLADTDPDWKSLSSMSIGSTDYIDYNTNSYEKYSYRIKILSLRNNSVKYSNEITVTKGVPASPSNLELMILSPNSIKLQWKDNSFNEDGFIIERRLPSYGFFSQIDKLDSDSTNYIENDLIPGELYYYRVKAINKSGASEYSNEVYTLPHTPKTFDDLKNHNWAKEAIDNLSNRGVISGKTDNLFYPDDQITRAEFVSLVIRSFKLSRIPVGYLIDVVPSDWYYKDIMTAKSIGIISADDGYFNPDLPITREDMAVIIYKTLKTINKPLPSHDTRILDGYLDKEQITSYALPYMASLKGEKVIDGRSSTILAPKDTATRAEAAVIINRIIDR